MKNFLALMLITVIFYSCKPTQLVFISVLEPAPVTLPSYIKTVSVVNRSLASEKTKAIDVVDKIFSLEGPNLDKEGSLASINGLTDELIKNNRFTQVKLLDNTDLRTTTPGLFPSPLQWDVIEKICRENNTDALFSLELFDTDSKISYAANPVTINTPVGNIPGIEHKASMLTFVKTGWRIYDPSGRNIIDEYPITRQLSYYGKGINPVVAAAALIGRKEAVKEVGDKTGHAYGLRIIPYWIRVSRDYYVKGTDNFIIARRKAQTGNWKEAGELWQKETTNTDGKLAGRACYNMAIISEINGDLDMAIQWAQKAYENYNNHLALNYVNLLKDRKTNNLILKDQQPE
jgi:Family of unknown function (DUF6340)